MGDMKDEFQSLKQLKQNRRLNNRDSSTAMLARKGYKFERFNDGNQLYLFENDCDFWPSTGLFIFRKTGKRGRGVFNLLKELQKGLLK